MRQVNIFFIKWKLDMGSFVDICVLPCFHLNLSNLLRPKMVLMFRAIFGSDQVNSGNKWVKHRNQQTIKCQVLVR